MMDYSNEIFTILKKGLSATYKDLTVTGEYTQIPSKFPCVTLEEISNTEVRGLMDSSHNENYRRVQYRLQVFSNSASGKKTQAKKILSTADGILRELGFRRITYAPRPSQYSSTIYEIRTTYEAVISRNGQIYRRQQ